VLLKKCPDGGFDGMKMLGGSDFEPYHDLLVPAFGCSGLEDVIKLLFHFREGADANLVTVGPVEENAGKLSVSQEKSF
jgi:hypothetical protein